MRYRSSSFTMRRTVPGLVLVSLLLLAAPALSPVFGQAEEAREPAATDDPAAEDSAPEDSDAEAPPEEGPATLDIVILPISAPEDEARLSAVADTIEETISLAFRLLQWCPLRH